VIKNYTPHTLTILLEDGRTVSIPSSGTARVEMSPPVLLYTVDCDGTPVPVLRTEVAGKVFGLPEREPGVFLVVSLLTVRAAPTRDDLLIPNGVVRDRQGRVIGCRSLAIPAR